MKAEFALDLFMMKDKFAHLVVPTYIYEGLSWLESQLDTTQKLLLNVSDRSKATTGAAHEPEPIAAPVAAQ